MKKFRPFTSYSGNVREEVRDLPLARLTAIVGPAASGKSSIGIGMKLALTGQYAPVGKLPSRLLGLAANPDLGIQVHLSGPDGTASWELRVKHDGTAVKPTDPVFSGPIAELSDDERYCILPSVSIRELLKDAKGEKKLREALARRFGEEAPTPSLPTTALLVWNEEAQRLTASGSTQESLLSDLSASFRQRALEASAKIKTLSEKLENDRKVVRENSMGMEMLVTYEQQLKDFSAWRQYDQSQTRLEACQQEVENIEDDIVEVMAELDAIRAAAPSPEITSLEEARDRLGTARTLLAAAETSGSCCPVCTHPIGDKIHALISTLKEAVQQRTEELSAFTQRSTAFELAERTDTLRGLKRDLLDFEREISELQNMTPPSSPRPTMVESDLAAEVYRLRDVARAKASLDALTEQVRQLQEAHRVYKDCEKEAEVLLEKVLAGIASKASEQVSKYMRHIDGLGARLDPTTSEWFVVRPNGEEYGPYPAMLCGTEQTALFFGLAGAWTEGAPFRFPIFDDDDTAGLSPDGMRAFYKACEDAVERGAFDQVVVIHNNPDLVPANWLKIEKSRLEGV